MPIGTGTRLGSYELLAQIGAGGMGEVYKAHDTKLGRDVAIKILPEAFAHDPERLARFQREAKMLAALNHPNIATIHGLEQSNGTHYLVMELVPGETLAEHIKREGAVPVEEAMKIAVQIAEALEAAHEKGIIHRDLKPANVKVTPEGKVKVLDFGLAKAFAGDSGLDSSNAPTVTAMCTEEGRILGTPAYMSPEQARGKPVDKRTDMWAFGCVFYELLTGKRAFRGETRQDTVAAVLEREPDWQALPTSTPAKIRDLLGEVLQKDLKLRMDDLASARMEIEEIQRHASAAELLADLKKVDSRRLRRLAAAVLAVVILGIGAATIPQARDRISGWLGISRVPQERQLAVLPFEVVGADSSAKAFGDGLTETLTAELTQLTLSYALEVISASEVRAKRVVTASQARQEFGVNLVLEGNLLRLGDRVRVNYGLVDTRTHRQLTADSITVAASDPFAVQDQVVHGALRMLELGVHPPELESLQNHGTQTPGAYDLYLQARGYLQNYDRPENVDTAISLFEQAVQLDASDALAYAGLGEAYWKKYLNSNDPRWIDMTRAYCEQALHLDDKLSGAHACLGAIATGTGHYENAVLEFERALSSEPTNDDAYIGLAHAYELLNKSADAEKTYRRAIELRPQYWGGYSWLGAFYFRQMRYPQAAEMFSKVIFLTPDSFHGYDNLGAAYLTEGRYPQAIENFEHSISLRPTAYAYSNLGTAYFYLRQFDDATASYQRSLKLNEGDYEVWWNLGDAYYWNPRRNPQAGEAYRQCISLGGQKLKVDPRDVYVIGVVAVCQAMVSDGKAALEQLQHGLALAPKDVELSFKAALVYNQLGEIGQALQWLSKALAAGYPVSLARDTPVFDNLQESPRFRELLTSSK